LVGIPTWLTLAAAGWLLAAIAMAALWAWHLRVRNAALGDASWTAIVAGLAILYANVGDGAWSRRSAIAWMMGSWGARLVVSLLYAPVDASAERLRDAGSIRSFWFFQARAASAVFFSLPALLASLNPAPILSSVEIAACGLWIVAFALETTADRELLRFRSNPANAGLVCRTGLWRYTRHAGDVFECVIWFAFALFAAGSPGWPWGWAAFACPAAMTFWLFRRNAIDPVGTGNAPR
jgi:steroid 5-alpha reductase family enzyme